MVSRRLRVAAAAIVAGLGASFCFVAPAGAVDPANATVASSAVDWIVTQQQPDGGFEVAGFPGFETPDAVLAIAEAAQTGATWSTAEALAAVEALEYGGSGGPTPVDALDDWVLSAHSGAGVNAGEASKLVLLVTSPLGLDPQHFGASDTDLAAIVYPSGCASPPDTSGLFFLETTFVAFAGDLLCGAADPTVLATVRAAQRADGGWNYLGDPDDVPFPTDSDVDTTALAVQALVAGGAAWNDPAITAALRFLATQQSATGAFLAFGEDDPNATSVAMLAVTAAGFDPGSPCWRDTVEPARAGSPYSDPSAWLRGEQEPDGHVASPNDGFGTNTFATSQSVQGLLRTGLPVERASGAPTCVIPGGEVVTAPDPVDPVELVPRFTG
ncbi:MAG: prenyltransferase/squalene oxidase repeat-containing protein [Acidimicrobiia bacterium]|jgi:hypothetical protein